MSKEWYDLIALKNKGYRSNAIYTVEGHSGENVFESKVIELLKESSKALDAGCGDGEFTIKMSQYGNHVVGFDNSEELLKIANEQLEKSNAKNLEFVYGWTKDESQLPFKDEEFDLIFCRRGPTSILNHPRILKSKGTIIGIHSAEKSRVEERLKENNFTEIEFEVFDKATAVFPNEEDFIKFLSAFPGNPDYSLPEYSKIINQIIQENIVDNRLTYKQWRYVWKARKV